MQANAMKKQSKVAFELHKCGILVQVTIAAFLFCDYWDVSCHSC